VVQATSWEAEAASDKLQAIIIIGPQAPSFKRKNLKAKNFEKYIPGHPPLLYGKI